MEIHQFDSESSIVMIQELSEKHNNYEIKKTISFIDIEDNWDIEIND